MRKLARGKEPEKNNIVDLLKINNVDLLVSTSISAIANMVADANISATTRLAAARTVLELAGVLGPRRDAGGSRPSDSMSDSDLRRAIETHQSALADRAKPVSAPQGDDASYNVLKDID